MFGLEKLDQTRIMIIDFSDGDISRKERKNRNYQSSIFVSNTRETIGKKSWKELLVY